MEKRRGKCIAANAAELVGPVRAAETAGDLALDFEHAQVAFGLIVVEGHAEVMQERQDGGPMRHQPIEQVACRRLFGSSPFASRWRGGWPASFHSGNACRPLGVGVRQPVAQSAPPTRPPAVDGHPSLARPTPPARQVRLHRLPGFHPVEASHVTIVNFSPHASARRRHA